MEHLTLRGAKDVSDIYIEPGLLSQAGACCARRFAKASRVHIITDDVVAPLYLSAVADSFSLPVSHSVLPTGEEHKTLDSIQRLYRDLAENGLTRSDLVVALGGGVIGDMAGFAAATYLRGVSLCQIPTTLLAQVDSSVGGKCGVDLPQGKNLVGAFYQPSLVLIDPEALNTLPAIQRVSGMAEVYKYGLIQQPELLGLLTDFDANARDIIARCVTIKRDIVQQDEYDTGLRMLLNFGHTIGHAVEKLGDFTRYTHGQGVAIGMVAALKISAQLGLCPPELVCQQEAALLALGLPTSHPYSDRELCQAMLSDKKKMGDTIHMILLRQPGQPEITPLPVSRLDQLIAATH